MRKIDLHIHTISSERDSNFNFCIDKLQEYVKMLGIDCIAITNHNLFDLEQYREISKALDIQVLPGIEINLEDGHLLLISEKDELDDFYDKCNIVKDIMASNEKLLSSQLGDIFINLNKYLLIPHYDKKPSISLDLIDKLKSYIFAGEVSSPKKFKYCIQDAKRLVPVLFSDIRISEELKEFPPNQTYLDANDVSLKTIKNCLLDKNKVFLSPTGGHSFFQAFEDGQVLSNGLNIILGERSSGKSYTLNELSRTYNQVKYIKQFELVETDEAKDVENFNKILSAKQSTVADTYLKEFKDVVEDIAIINPKDNEIAIDEYIASLLKVAQEEEKKDAYAKASLFDAIKYSNTDNSNLKNLIDSVQNLITNTEYKGIIERNIPHANLIKLALELMILYTEQQELNSKRMWINSLIENIKDELKSCTSSSSITDIDFYNILFENKKIEIFNTICKLVQHEKTIESTTVRRFKVVASSKKYQSARELGKKAGKKLTFSNAFDQYNEPLKYLESLKRIEALETSDYYKYFVNIEYKILNESGVEVSGGERSEFNLLQKIKDAHHYEMLLIDEPESSFDNLFLKNEVDELIKEISKSIPVVIVTHNSTIGASIKPDFILYCQRMTQDGKSIYKIFSGSPSDNFLKSVKGETIKNFNVMLDCLEAGDEAYIERKRSYEILKN